MLIDICMDIEFVVCVSGGVCLDVIACDTAMWLCLFVGG